MMLVSQLGPPELSSLDHFPTAGFSSRATFVRPRVPAGAPRRWAFDGDPWGRIKGPLDEGDDDDDDDDADNDDEIKEIRAI